MGLRWIQAFNTAGESTTLAQMNYGTTTTVGNFSPPVDGTIKKVVIFIGSEAATSLVEDVRVELESTDWSPNRLYFAANGSGLRTATTPQHFPFEYDTDLPMKKNTSIRGDYIHDSGSPVTSRIRVYFGFQ